MHTSNLLFEDPPDSPYSRFPGIRAFARTTLLFRASNKDALRICSSPPHIPLLSCNKHRSYPCPPNHRSTEEVDSAALETPPGAVCAVTSPPNVQTDVLAYKLLVQVNNPDLRTLRSQRGEIRTELQHNVMSFGPLVASSASSFTSSLCGEVPPVFTNLTISLPDQIVHKQSVLIFMRNVLNGVLRRSYFLQLPHLVFHRLQLDSVVKQTSFYYFSSVSSC